MPTKLWKGCIERTLHKKYTDESKRKHKKKEKKGKEGVNFRYMLCTVECAASVFACIRNSDTVGIAVLTTKSNTQQNRIKH